MSKKHIKAADTGQSEQTSTGALAAGSNINPPGVPQTTVFDTSGATIDQSSGFVGLLGLLDIGQSFTTQAGSSVLSELRLDLADTTAATDGGTITVQLFTDNGGPGVGTLVTTLGTVLDSSLNSGNSLVEIPISNGPTLAGNTRYWIELSNNSLISGAVWNATDQLTNTTEGSTEWNERVNALNAVAVTTSDTSTNPFFAFGMTVVTSTCYAAGTRILTARGEVAVEDVRVGDRAMALRRGGLAEITWIGRREVNLLDHPRPHAINPVRIVAGAIGPNLPHRDLVVSPDHALFIDGALVAARYLINDATIVQEAPERITYYHIELDAHDIMLAEGLAAESFLDVGNRGNFADGSRPLMLHPDFAMQATIDPAAVQRIWNEKSCAPSLTDEAARTALHRRLLDRAVSLGHTTTDETDLHLLAGGRRIRPKFTRQGAQFRLPQGLGRVQIVSRSVTPSHVGHLSNDGRTLGVGVTAITLDGREIALDDPRLTTGWHANETALRWTNGCAHLETNGARVLILRLHAGLTYWTGAAATEHRQAA